MLALLEKECFSCPWSEDSFYECLSNERFCFVGLFEDGELVGYGGLVTVLDEGDVANIAVRTDKRGRGLGKTLLSALCEEAERRGVTYLHLEVRESNAPARRLYESFGFQIDGIRKNYYTKPQENAVLMTKKL
ncbi:MAG: ribosomal protein S18-alanine N-acetyltransferase [Clostridia bacterium]|nr:ribosomal protein S18-alanine N-acetyltransferase [Clostridia bacterium]